MFTHKLFVATALLITVGSAYSLENPPAQVAPLTASDIKLKKCELHGTALKVGNVPVSYGIASGWPMNYYKASQRSFPRARSRVVGGCTILPDMPRIQAVKFCPQCRKAEKKWLAAHK